MAILGSTGQKWLKGVHLVFAGSWIGSGFSIIILNVAKAGMTNGDVVFGVNEAIHFVDMNVVVPCAFGSLITGLLYSLLTNWGWFRHGWMIFKWVVTVGAILFGTFWLGPVEVNMLELSDELRGAALQSAEYLHWQTLHWVWGSVQVATLIVAVFISIFKPWKNIWKKRARGA
jgi:flagellar biosynthesis protein FliQ